MRVGNEENQGTIQPKGSDEYNLGLEQVISNFFARVSHEIRTPLTAIMGYTDILRDKWKDGDGDSAKCLEAISKNNLYLLSLVNNLLDYSKIEANQLELKFTRSLLKEEIEFAVLFIKQEALAKNLALNVKYFGLLPEFITTDIQKFRQILNCLLSNSLKSTEQGFIELHVYYDAPSASVESHFLNIHIIDSGCGMNSAILDQLFQPFARGQRRTMEKEGIGLGLALARNLARKLGGDLSLVSTLVGKGSCFKLTLKLQDPSENIHLIRMYKDNQDNFESQQQKSVFSEIKNKLSGKIIILAEDVEDIQMLITGYLETAGAKVISCGNGQEAIKAAETMEHDLILMDVQMPILTGYEATQHLRSKGYKKPILALTAHVFKHEVDEGFRVGCNQVLSKPVNVEELIMAIKDGIEKNDTPNFTSTATKVFPIKSLLAQDEHIKSTFAVFMKNLRIRIKEIEQLITTNRWEDVAKSAHKLKGSAGCYGFPQLVDLAVNLENEVAQPDKSSEVIQKYMGQIQNTIEGIELGLHS